MKLLTGDEDRKLSALAVSKSKASDKVQRLSDGHGLFLMITKTGSKYWRYRYRFGDKQKDLALGVFPGITLSKAREMHREAYNLLAHGIDPNVERKIDKLIKTQAANESFEAISLEWIEIHLKDKSADHINRCTRLLIREISPHIGQRPIAEITAQELLATIRRIESRGTHDSAHRARQVAGQVFAYAIQTGRAERNVANDLKGALASVKQTHRAAITDPTLLGKLLKDMQSSRSGIIVKTAMLLSPMLFQRPGEIRAMEWKELDLEEAVWKIPAEKMKMRLPHIVPLPKQAIKLLKEIEPLTGRGTYVFPSARGTSRCLSENGVRTALRDMGYGNDVVTPHGFRATARTMLDEVLGYRVDIIEHQLAHAVRDSTGRAYNRTSFLELRAEMMQGWADYLDELKNT